MVANDITPLIGNRSTHYHRNCLEDGGGLLAELFNAVYCALTHYQKAKAPNKSLRCHSSDGRWWVTRDPDAAESDLATSLRRWWLHRRNKSSPLNSADNTVNSSEFNELILRASQGVTRTNDQRQASFERAVQPNIQVADTDEQTIVIATKNPGKARESNPSSQRKGFKSKHY